METPGIQAIIVAFIILAAALYLARVLYRMFIQGEADCHCGSGECPAGKNDHAQPKRTD